MNHSLHRDREEFSTQRCRGLFWIACSALLQSVAAVLSKQAGISSIGGDLASLVLNPWYVGVLVSLVLQSVCWLIAIRRLPLSYAYPIISLVMPINLLASYVLFDESIAWNHMLGILIIMLGVSLVASEES